MSFYVINEILGKIWQECKHLILLCFPDTNDPRIVKKWLKTDLLDIIIMLDNMIIKYLSQYEPREIDLHRCYGVTTKIVKKSYVSFSSTLSIPEI